MTRSKASPRSPLGSLGGQLSRALAYGGAAALFALLALGPSVAAVGLAGARSPFGWLLAAAWTAIVVLVAWGFGWAVEARPRVARRPAQGRPAAFARPVAAELRRGRRLMRHHRRLLARKLNVPAMFGAICVAALMVAVMVRAWG